MDANEQPDPEFVAKLNTLRNTDWYRNWYRKYLSDPNTQPDPVSQPGPFPPFPHAGPFFLTVYDADGEPLARGDATVLAHCGSIGLGPSYAIRFVQLQRGGQLLPVRPNPQPHPHPDADLQPDSYPIPARPGLDTTDPDALIHTHRHPHRARFGEFLTNGLVVERYDHTHAHAHAVERDDRTYHNDHDH